MIAVAVPFGLLGGKTWSASLLLGAVGGSLGLVSWGAYHLVSGRNNGLILVAGFVTPLVMSRHQLSWGLALVQLMMAFGIGWIVGLWVRWCDGR